jgi:hypothetical protein
MADVAIISPITVEPSTRRATAPEPLANQSGRQPKMKANEVIRIGRRRRRAPWKHRSTDSPRSARWRQEAISCSTATATGCCRGSTKPGFTAIPYPTLNDVERCSKCRATPAFFGGRIGVRAEQRCGRRVQQRAHPCGWRGRHRAHPTRPEGQEREARRGRLAKASSQASSRLTTAAPTARAASVSHAGPPAPWFVKSSGIMLALSV